MLKKINKMWILILLSVTFLIIQIVALSEGLRYGKDENVGNELSGEIYFVSNRIDKSKELDELIEEFEKIHPNVHVKLELMGDVEEILQRKAAVGDLPDVTIIPDSIDKNELSKYFIPIDDLGFSKDNIYNYSNGLGNDNTLYGVTTSIMWNGVIYNKNIFKNLGIDELPSNEEEFFEICSKIKKNNIIPIALNYRQSWIMNMWINTVPYLYDYGIEDKLIKGTSDILQENGEFNKSLNLARKIYRYGYCEEDILNYDWAQCKDDIINNKIAMIIWNSNFINQLYESGMDVGSLGMFPIPETNVIEIVGDYKFGISKNTKYPEAAKEFLKFIFQDDRYAKAVNITSSLKKSEETKDMISDLSIFNMPIIFQADIISNGESGNDVHEKYTYLKKSVGLNYNFVQNYITCDDCREV
ncbi:MAG: ABC transporter substrate-binding protein, partial [Clostridium sp.]